MLWSRRLLAHRIGALQAVEAEARLSYAALGDLFDFELPDLPAPQKRALDAALLRAEVEGAPPDQRAVSVASLGVLRALAAAGPVVLAVDDVQWLDAPSARVLAFVVRRLEDAPIRFVVALRAGSGGDPLGLGQVGPAPSLHRMSVARWARGDDPPPASSNRRGAHASHHHGDLAFAAAHAGASRQWARRATDPAIRANRCPPSPWSSS